MWKAAALAGVMGTVGIAQATAPALNSQELTPAVKAFLADHGDLCLAWYSWPVELTAEDQQSGRNEAVQLPVLERLGIVRSDALPLPAVTHSASAAIGADSTAPGPEQAVRQVPTKRYALTAKGKQYYLKRKRETLDVHGQIETHDGDFCVAHLTLDKVVKWSPPDSVNNHLETIVRYTYHISSAPWMSDPEARQVFPVVDRIIRGAGKLEMTASVREQDGRWVPVMPGH
jgi:hypothetical protein